MDRFIIRHKKLSTQEEVTVPELTSKPGESHSAVPSTSERLPAKKLKLDDSNSNESTISIRK